MRYATVSSGISAESAAWVPLGWEPVWYSEIAKFPSAVLAHHYPNTPNLGDMTKIHEDERFQQSIGTIDLISGGTPCQSFSVAGLRKGMADPRGNLALTYLGIVDKLRPRWVVWENVPGVLSSNKGRDFGAFLGALGQLGYGWAYRILDAQHFGVPQRRRRVFVVGHIGGWRRAAAVLFEPESLLRHSTPGRKAGQRVAGSLSSRTSGGGGLGTDFECGGGVVAPTLQSGGKAAGSCTQQDAENGAIVIDTTQITSPENGYNPKPGNPSHPLAKNQHAPLLIYAYQNPNNPLQKSEASPTLRKGCGLTDERNAPAIIIKGAAIGRKPENGPQRGEVLEDGTTYTLNATEQHAVCFESRFARNGRGAPSEIVPPLKAQSGDTGKGDGAPLVFQSKASESNFMNPGEVSPSIDKCKGDGLAIFAARPRRLTPVECERLQGFPDNYTDIPGWKTNNPEKYGGNGTPDGPRYKALGNSMAVPVVK